MIGKSESGNKEKPDTLTEEKPKDVFESGDTKKLDEYDKAASAHDAESVDLAVSMEALTSAIAALEKGVADSSFFHGGVGPAVRKVAMSSEKVSDADRSIFGHSSQSVTVSTAHHKAEKSLAS